jgi:SAM-dependent methyltransferase
VRPHVERFESQADTFDRRKGLSPAVAADVAREVLDSAGAGTGDLVVELGAGTGEIGCHIPPFARYVGIDGSSAMLDAFRARAPEATLVHADADDDWPVRSSSATAVFASRAAHLLDVEHLVAEVGRVCRPGGTFLLGRVQRDPEAVRSRLRHERRRLLGKGRSGEQASEHVLDRLAAAGARRLTTRVVASWPTRVSPAQVLAGWDSEGERLRAWAEREFGDLDRVHESTEQYVLAGTRLPEEAWTTRS